MNTLATQTATAVASLQNLKQGLTNVRATIPTAGGDPIMKFQKGDWCYGQDETEVEEGSRWAINPFGIEHGYVAWKDRPEGSKEPPEQLNNVMVPLTTAKPPESALPKLPDDKPCRGWDDQLMFQMKCTNGEDAGTQVRFFMTSVGGLAAGAKLVDAIMAQLDRDPDKIVPVVELKHDSYNHKVYKKVFVPVLEIVDWITMDGPAAVDSGSSPAAAEPQDQGAAAADAAPVNTAAGDAGLFEKVEPEQADETAPAASGRRRRRAA